eukprot:603027-Pelagomonas_calceolata.AAC.2
MRDLKLTGDFKHALHASSFRRALKHVSAIPMRGQVAGPALLVLHFWSAVVPSASLASTMSVLSLCHSYSTLLHYSVPLQYNLCQAIISITPQSLCVTVQHSAALQYSVTLQIPTSTFGERLSFAAKIVSTACHQQMQPRCALSRCGSVVCKYGHMQGHANFELMRGHNQMT